MSNVQSSNQDKSERNLSYTLTSYFAFQRCRNKPLTTNQWGTPAILCLLGDASQTQEQFNVSLGKYSCKQGRRHPAGPTCYGPAVLSINYLSINTWYSLHLQYKNVIPIYMKADNNNINNSTVNNNWCQHGPPIKDFLVLEKSMEALPFEV